MLAKRKLDNKYLQWNWQWHAPFGRTFLKELIPKKYWYSRWAGPLVGMYVFQPNSDTRKFEYPWAVDVAGLKPGMNVLDLGGGYSGFSFTLSKMGMNVTNVDPFVDYGPSQHYEDRPSDIVRRLNRVFHTNITLKHCTLKEAYFPDESFDRIFCISTIEHLQQEEIMFMMQEIHRILKPSGLCILTVDLFLNLEPFTPRMTNEFGRNVSIKWLTDTSRMELCKGNKEELFGYEEFAPKNILQQLESYYLGSSYPALVQAFVLKK